MLYSNAFDLEIVVCGSTAQAYDAAMLKVLATLAQSSQLLDKFESTKEHMDFNFAIETSDGGKGTSSILISPLQGVYTDEIDVLSDLNPPPPMENRPKNGVQSG